MSFPVLQRMDRKRPEIIQPINWKAEALKGLASGFESGIKIANTMQQIQTQRLENSRKEQESIVNRALAKETTRKLQLDNDESMRQAAIKKAYIEGVQVNQLNEIGLRMQADVAAYTTGVSTIMQASGVPVLGKAVGPIDTPVPKTFTEGLSSGYLIKLQSQAKETTNLMMDRAVSVADRFAAWDDVRGKAIPFGSAIDSYVDVGDPTHPVMGMSASLKPFMSKNTVTDAVNMMPMTIVVTEQNSKDLLSETPKDKDGNPLAVAGLIASQRPVEVPLSKVIGGLGKGYYIDEVADEIKSADNPEPFIKYLEKRLANKPEIVQELRAKAGLDIAVVKGGKEPETRTTIPEIPKAPRTRTVTTPDGKKTEIPVSDDSSVFEKIGDIVGGEKDRPLFMKPYEAEVNEIYKRVPNKRASALGMLLGISEPLTDVQKAENYNFIKQQLEAQTMLAEKYVNKLKGDPGNKTLRSETEKVVGIAKKLKEDLSLYEAEGAKFDTPKTETAAKLKTVVDTAKPTKTLRLKNKATGKVMEAPNDDVYKEAISSGKYEAM